MKKIKIISLTVLLVSALFFSIAQNAEEIITKHQNAHGGAEKWESFQTMKISGKFTGFSIEKDFICIKARPAYYYSEYYLGKYPITESFNGVSGWILDYWQDIDFPRHTNKAENNALRQKSEFCTPFFNYKELGSSVELMGKENVDGVDVYVLKLSRADGFIETWFLNAETYLEYKCESPWVDFAYPVKSEVYFDDFRRFQGVVLPYYIERSFGSRNRIIEIDEIEFNVNFDEGKTQMPRSPEMEKLAFLEGKWAVNVETMSRRGNWYAVDSTNSKIAFSSTNLLEEKISYERMFPMVNSNNYSYNSNTKKYRLAVYHEFMSGLELFEGDFKDGKLVFDNCHISYGNEAEISQAFIQYTFSKITSESFILEIKGSTDKGITWTDQEKFTYTRIVD
ncbi:MAG: hypothetical protein ISR55_01395 [Bacteroidetes bacterium]|nr:hypothetical protein [Bacteroidota bacterium]MBL6962454.1 hypothetical protein [Bacteroidota bacterium]